MAQIGLRAPPVYVRSGLVLAYPLILCRCFSSQGLVGNKENVILHQFKQFGNTPSGSPPCLKLETYLRMAGIPYVSERGLKLSSKGKMPWIEYKGIAIADSGFIIKFLNQEFDLDLDKGLSEEEKATACALARMVEENTYWTLVYYRWVDNFDKLKKAWKVTGLPPIDFIIVKLFQLRVKNYLYSHGIGRHSRDEVYSIANDDIQALSKYLGKKPYMMGESPSLVDASVFGILASILWSDKSSPQHRMVKDKFSNLEDFCERMKARYWTDWDDIVKRRQYKK